MVPRAARGTAAAAENPLERTLAAEKTEEQPETYMLVVPVASMVAARDASEALL
jgi:hypothetical protein